MADMHVALGRAVFSRRRGEGDRLTPPDKADQRLGLGQRHQAAQGALRCPVSVKSALSHLNRPIRVPVSIKAFRWRPVSVDLACCADVEVAEARVLTVLLPVDLSHCVLRMPGSAAGRSGMVGDEEADDLARAVPPSEQVIVG